MKTILAAFLTITAFVVTQAGADFAQVDVPTLNPQLLIESESSGGWRQVPDALRGSMIHSVSNGHPTGVDGGVVNFDVTQTGLVYLVGHWGYEGNTSGGWTGDRLFMDDLIGLGWSYFDDMKSQGGSRYRVLSKTVTSGEHYQIRVNKYGPPLPVTLTAESGTLANPLPPWPQFGPLRVADYDPTDLVLGNSEHDFIEISPELEGQTIFSIQRRISGGELEFEVVSDTTVRMAGHFDYEGNNEGDWDEFRKTFDDLLSEGWVGTGTTLTASNGRTWDVLEKQVYAGELYNIRVNKYSTPLLIMPTLFYGDANGDGIVSGDDYASVQFHFGNVYLQPGGPGDASVDGMVSADDYAIVQAHFGNTSGLGGKTTVPEPATLALLVLGGVAMLRRRSAQVLRRRRRRV